MKFDNRIPWVTLLLGAAAALAFAMGPAAFDALVWRTDWVQSGEFWRFATGHLAHASASHFVWDVGAFAILGSYVEQQGRRRLMGLLGVAALLTEFALRWSGRFELYCGLSGLDMALFAAAAIRLLQKGRKESDALFEGLAAGGLALGIVKVGLEIFAGSPLLVSGLQSSFSVAWEAHLAGLAAALLSRVRLPEYRLL